jgi:23S rRNA (guanine2445-N2)-methyltransferase / 23S rRNA (guanine2069-N7)-methyltransferase
MTTHYPVHITTAHKLEGLLLNEAHAHGLAEARETRGAVRGEASLDTIYRLLLGSRLASRVLIPLTEVPAGDADDLYKALRAFRWEDHLLLPLTLAVQCHGSTAGIRHTRFGAQRVKDAIADRARSMGTSVSVDTDQPEVRISVRLRHERAQIALDLAGDSLHRRGYRQDGVEAPLKEPLAAAILMRAGWPERSACSRVLFDPCCGSGTLLAEGAMMAANVAPRLAREHFAVTGWYDHDPARWRACRDQLAAEIIDDPERLPFIQGFDHDPAAVRAAQTNLARVGVACRYRIDGADIHASQPRWPDGPGMMITNPPYGHRTATPDGADSVYQRLGERARAELGGWRVAVLSDRSQHLAAMGLKSERVYRLLNGQLECQLGVYTIHSQAASASSQGNNRTAKPAPELTNRLRKNDRHLARWRRRDGIHCYRVYDADIPDYPFAIDVYQTDSGNHVRLMEKQASGAQPRRNMKRRRAALRSAAETYDVSEASVHHAMVAGSGASAGDDTTPGSGDSHIVREGNARYWVAVTNPVDTGLSLSRRGLRERLYTEAADRSLLNLFAGTGAATIQAALGGARDTTSVDPSSRNIDWLARNLSLNDLTGGDQNAYVVADIAEWLVTAAEAHQSWDLILLNGADGAERSVMASQALAGLVRAATRVLNPTGWIYLVAPASEADPAASVFEGCAVTEITRSITPKDYRRGQAPFRCWLLQSAATD